MAKDEQRQEEQAAAEERDEVLEVMGDTDGPDMSAVATPVDDKVSSSTHIERGEAEAEVVADDAAESGRTSKAGKRSAKAQRETDEAEEKAARKEAGDSGDKAEAPKPRIAQKPNPLKRHGKAYREAAELVDKTKQYELGEALDLAKKTASAKFDATVELHANLGVDPRQADQMVRASVTLPAGTGKKLRVAVLAPTAKHADAKKAGADIVSDGDIIAQIDKGKLDFDVLIATPDMMAQLSKVAKVLGPRGLMPNPKSGTVAADVATATKEAKAGKVEFRIDKQAIVHAAIGKASFTPEQLDENAKAMIEAILQAKPSAAKGTYVTSLALATSMGPGIKLDVQKAIAAAHAKR